jgi:hypothetical protein
MIRQAAKKLELLGSNLGPITSLMGGLEANTIMVLR